ncbi:MAG: hypothetical protein C0614_12130 [Desulfuromonas sp.]|nr:MAG: hypothetical protein C0614_12130 [Desulfuromonas sp.]
MYGEETKRLRKNLGQSQGSLFANCPVCYGYLMFRLPLQRTLPDKGLDLAGVSCVLFDLDGTLVDVDMNRFIPVYLQRLTARLGDLADPRALTAVIREAVYIMLNGSNGSQTMEQLLLNSLDGEFGIGADEYRQRLELFVEHDLPGLRPLVKGHPLARPLIETCLVNGWQPVLATNPIFPMAVVEARMQWGEIDGLPFQHVTAYETSRYCKPQAGYFHQLLDHLGTVAESCLMVGNDTEHDLAAAHVGIQTCLLTPWLIDRTNGHYQANWQGDHEELLGLFLDGSSVGL